MKIGASYMGHHNPQHIETDIKEMVSLQMDDVLLAAQENDFIHYPGKLQLTARIAKDHGIRPIIIFWGALNVFGGGRMSHFLLSHPEGFQVAKDGAHLPHGCYVNPVCVGRIQEMIDISAKYGFEGYFVDEPSPMRECFCASCQKKFREISGEDLLRAQPEMLERFRAQCVIDYVRHISDYCKANHPNMRTMCCLMPCDRSMWKACSEIKNLDEIGTDIYWINNDEDVENMRPLIRELDCFAKTQAKTHQEWLQCWDVRAGRENRIVEQGKVILQEPADALYVWAWKGQIGTTESCDDPLAAWARVCEVFRMAKQK
ncbi:MAG TPA: hypothetical protein PKH07_05595 [bacterium]|nr:hypothetical protein [bacterium]